MWEDLYSFFYYFFRYYFRKIFSFIRCVFLFIYKTYNGEEIILLTLKMISLICGVFLVNSFLFNYVYYNWFLFNCTYYNFFNYRGFIYFFIFSLVYLVKFIFNSIFLSKYLSNNFLQIFTDYDDKKVINLSLKDKSKFYKNMFLFFNFIKFFLNNGKLFINYLSVFFRKVILHYFGFVIKFNTILFKSCLSHLTRTFFIFWRPLFKKLSYFGLFRSYRTKWFWKN